MTGEWYHRGPCCRPCSICGSREHFVWYEDGAAADVHICAAGCDGLPPAVVRMFA